MELASFITSTYDFGGLFGTCISGYFSDKTEKRVSVIANMLVFSIPILIFLSMMSIEEKAHLYIFIPLLGVLIQGATNVMSSAVSADLARDHSPHPKSDAKTTVIGIVNGVGVLGAALGQLLIGWIQTYGWVWVFVMLAGKG